MMKVTVQYQDGGKETFDGVVRIVGYNFHEDTAAFELWYTRPCFECGPVLSLSTIWIYYVRNITVEEM